MKKVFFVFLIGFVVLANGCSTIANQHGSFTGLPGLGGNVSRHTDPSKPVNPGQVAIRGINGPASDYSAALSLAQVENPDARKDAAEVMKTMSENQYGWGYGGGRSGGSPFSTDGKVQSILGSSNAFGQMINAFTFPIKVFIRGYSKPRIFGPGEVVEIEGLPHGKYEVALYNIETNVLVGTESFDTKRKPVRHNDKHYDFVLRLDGI